MIIYFSGTGNSRAVALGLAEKLHTEAIELTGKLLTAPSEHTLRPAKEGNEPIVWVFPVYSWGVPPVVVKFIRECNIDGAELALHHLAITCGDDAGMTAQQWRKLMASRSWRTGSATSIIMPNTYVLMKGFDTDPEAVRDKKLEEAPAMIAKTSERIAAGRSDDLIIRGRFPRFKSGIIYPWFKRYAMSPRPFHALDSCISCGRCAKSCPMDNITMTDGYPVWGDACALCLRCYHICPTHAVAYGKATDGKGQYLYHSK